MSTATLVTLTPAEAGTLEWARAILVRGQAVLRDEEPGTFRDGQGRKSLVMACYGLEESLEYHQGLRDGSRHPSDVDWEFADGRDNALECALDVMTEDIRSWAGAVILVCAEHCGPETERFVRDGESEVAA